MSPPIIIIIGGPRPRASDEFTSTMADNAVENARFDIQCQDESLGFADQAALLRAAADQLDTPAVETDTEV